MTDEKQYLKMDPSSKRVILSEAYEFEKIRKNRAKSELIALCVEIY